MIVVQECLAQAASIFARASPNLAATLVNVAEP